MRGGNQIGRPAKSASLRDAVTLSPVPVTASWSVRGVRISAVDRRPGYRLADGRIVVNDVMHDPDLMKVLGPLLARPETPS
jgi:hypothetical protein